MYAHLFSDMRKLLKSVTNMNTKELTLANISTTLSTAGKLLHTRNLSSSASSILVVCRVCALCAGAGACAADGRCGRGVGVVDAPAR